MSLSKYFKNSQYGFTLPMVLIFVLAFIAAPLLFWATSFSAKPESSVAGAKTSQTKEGFYVQVKSKSGSWDLVEYLCKSKEDCATSLTSGKSWEAISGGTTDGSSVKINYSDLWKDYSYIKLYVKPSWGSQAKNFNISAETVLPEGSMTSVEGVQTLILPLTAFDSGQYNFIIFSDN